MFRFQNSRSHKGNRLSVRKEVKVNGVPQTLIPKVGIEPTRADAQRILSPSSLPIPSLRLGYACIRAYNLCRAFVRVAGFRSCEYRFAHIYGRFEYITRIIHLICPEVDSGCISAFDFV